MWVEAPLTKLATARLEKVATRFLLKLPLLVIVLVSIFSKIMSFEGIFLLLTTFVCLITSLIFRLINLLCSGMILIILSNSFLILPIWRKLRLRPHLLTFRYTTLKRALIYSRTKACKRWPILFALGLWSKYRTTECRFWLIWVGLWCTLTKFQLVLANICRTRAKDTHALTSIFHLRFRSLLYHCGHSVLVLRQAWPKSQIWSTLNWTLLSKYAPSLPRINNLLRDGILLGLIWCDCTILARLWPRFLLNFILFGVFWVCRGFILLQNLLAILASILKHLACRLLRLLLDSLTKKARSTSSTCHCSLLHL